MTYLCNGVTKTFPGPSHSRIESRSMNLPISKPASVSDSHPVISTYSILLLSGMLFGIYVSGSVASETKTWVVIAASLGLVAYLAMSLASYKQKQTQLRRATMQVEERLDRHSHFDLRADELRLDQPNTESKPA